MAKCYCNDLDVFICRTGYLMRLGLQDKCGNYFSLLFFSSTFPQHERVSISTSMNSPNANKRLMMGYKRVPLVSREVDSWNLSPDVSFG